MRRRDRRLLLITVVGALLLGATGIAAVGLRDKAAFFYAPKDVVEKAPEPGTSARLGGLVAAGTVVRSEGGKIDFVVTDGAADVRVSYRGVLPDLFREGQGVVAEGRFAQGGAFEAETILARHDENYMPKEVADSLKAAGQWKEAPLPAGGPSSSAGPAYVSTGSAAPAGVGGGAVPGLPATPQ
jgi:cytochrome c-type biogenesis protein CcmE